VPVVLQVVTQEGNKDTLFGRVKCDLVFYDGLRALHLLFQLFEWLDNKAMCPSSHRIFSAGATCQTSPNRAAWAIMLRK